MTEAANRMLSEGGRVGLFVAATLAATAAIMILERTTPQVPPGVLALLGISLLLVVASLDRPRRPDS